MSSSSRQYDNDGTTTLLMKPVYIDSRPSISRFDVQVNQNDTVKIRFIMDDIRHSGVDVEHWFLQGDSFVMDSLVLDESTEVMDDDWYAFMMHDVVPCSELVSTGSVSPILVIRATTGKSIRRGNEVRKNIPLRGEIIIENVTESVVIRKIPVLVNMCKSVLECDVCQLAFHNCSELKTYSKDVHICNRSEIELVFQCQSLNPGVIQFQDLTDQESSVVSLSGVTVQAYSNRCIRILYTPNTWGRFEYAVFVENMNDPRNVQYIYIHSYVNPPADYYSFSIRNLESDQELRSITFADCLFGDVVSSILRIKNTGEEEAECNLSSSSPFITFSVVNHHTRRSEVEIPPELTADEDLNQAESSTASVDDSSSGPQMRLERLANTPFEKSRSFIEELADDYDDDDMPEVLDNAHVAIQSSHLTLHISPGMEKVVEVWYSPGPQSTDDNTSNAVMIHRLKKRDFLLFFSDLTFPASARVCKNEFDVSEDEVVFGDCNIGIKKSKTLTISNRSEMATVVKLMLHSKVVCVENALGESLIDASNSVANVTIEPAGSVVLTISLTARKVNLNYEKTLHIESLLCKKDILLKSSNMDPHHIIYHSLFYKIHPPVPRRAEILEGQLSAAKIDDTVIYFGEVNLHSPTLQSFTIENITKKSITLRITTSNRGVRVYSFDEALSRELMRSSRGSQPQASLIKSGEGPISASPNAADNIKSAARDSIDDSVINLKNQTSAIRPKPILENDMELSSVSHEEVPTTPSKGTDSTPAARRLRSNTSTTYTQGDHENVEDSIPIVRLRSHLKLEAVSKTPGESVASSASPRSSITWQSVLAEFERPQKMYFSGMEPKEEQNLVQQVSDRVEALRELMRVTEPVNVIVVPPQQMVRLGVVMQKSDSDLKDASAVGKLRALTEHIWIEQLNLDNTDMESIQRVCERGGADLEDMILQRRDVPLVAKAAASWITASQRRFNFGTVTLPSRSHRAVFLTNESALPLFFMIKKSGSFFSEYLRITKNERGIVKPYGTKEIQFEFHPSIPGSVNETLQVINMLDNSSTLDLVVKADVVRPERFIVDRQSLCFKYDGKPNNDLETIKIRNTHMKSREFELNIDSDLVPYKVKFSATASSIKKNPEVGDQIETLQHKYRIAETKNQLKKAKEIKSQIEDLMDIASRQEEDETKLRVVSSKSAKLVIEAEAEVTIQIRVQLVDTEGVEIPETVTGKLQIFHSKNLDSMIEVPISIENHLRRRVTSPIRRGIRGRYGLDTGMNSPTQRRVSNPIKSPSIGRAIPEGLKSRTAGLQPKNLNELQFSVEPKIIELGGKSVATSHLKFSIRISLSNSLESFQGDTQRNQLFRIYDGNEELRKIAIPHGTVMDLELETRLHNPYGGQHSRAIKVVADSVTKTVMLKYSIMYIHFLDLDLDFAGSPKLLDLAYQYLGTGKPLCMPIRLRNIYNTKLTISAVSNLKRQVYVFLDMKARTPFVNVEILLGQVVTAWVYLEPRLIDETSRVLNGGIQFIMENTFTCTVKFRATVGLSLWHVDKTSSGIEILSQDHPVITSLRVVNDSKRMPLQIRLHPGGESDFAAVAFESNSSPDQPLDALVAANGSQDISCVISVRKSSGLASEGLVTQDMRIENLINGTSYWQPLQLLIPPSSESINAALARFSKVERCEFSQSYVDNDGKICVSGLLYVKGLLELIYAAATSEVEIAVQDDQGLSFDIEFQSAGVTLRTPVILPWDVMIQRDQNIDDELVLRLSSGQSVAGQFRCFLCVRVNGHEIQVYEIHGRTANFRLVLDNMSPINMGSVFNGSEHSFQVTLRNFSEENAVTTWITGCEDFGEAQVVMNRGVIEGTLKFNATERLDCACNNMNAIFHISGSLNPSDIISIPLRAQLYLKLVDLPQELELPSISFPPPSDDNLACNTWFTIRNEFCEPVSCDFKLFVDDQWSEFVTVSLLQRVSNLDISRLKLGIGEQHDLKVVLHANSGARLSVPEYRNIVIGKVVVEIEDTKSEIMLKGTLLAGQSFTLSTSQLVFYTRASSADSTLLDLSMSNRSEGFHVRNLSKRTPLRIKVVSQTMTLPGFRLGLHGTEASEWTPVARYDEYAIAPDESVFVHVDLEPSTSHSNLSTDPFLALMRITDIRSPAIEQRVVVSLQPDINPLSDVQIEMVSDTLSRADQESGSDTMSDTHSESSAPPSMVTPNIAGVTPQIRESSAESSITLRGCMPIPGSNCRYRVDLGNREAGSEVVQWEIVLENTKNVDVEYELKVVANRKTIELSRYSGTLGKYEFHPVKMFLPTVTFGTFTTYVVLIEIKTQMMKLIRVDLEVVMPSNHFMNQLSQSDNNESPNSVYSLWVGGTRVDNIDSTSNVGIDLADVVHGYAYSSASFIVKNESNVPLNFQLSHTFSDENSARFSADSVTFIDMRKFTIQPRALTRIFLWIIPKQASVLQGRINVSCRNIKDNLVSFPVTGECIQRVLTFRHKSEVGQMPNINLNVVPLNFHPGKTTHVLEISNSHVENTVSLGVIKLCPSFKVSLAGKSMHIHKLAPGDTVELEISVEADTMDIDETKTLVDHLILTNQSDSRITERHHVVLHYSRDLTQTFNSVLLHGKRFHVEEQIVQFFNRVTGMTGEKMSSSTMTMNTHCDFLVLADLLVFFVSNSFAGHMFYKQAVLFYYIVEERKLLHHPMFGQQVKRFLTHVPLHETDMEILYKIRENI